MNSTYQVEIVDTNQTYTCKESESLLSGMERAGLHLSLVGCRGGGCGICKIQIIEGNVEYGAMSKAHISDEARANGMALACRVMPRGDVKIRIIGAKS